MPPPSEHALTQERLHAALWSPDTPKGLGRAEAVDRRFAVYRNNVQHGLSRALAARFPVIERLVGAEFFAAMARSFAAHHPPQSPVLLEWGAALPDFLAAFPPTMGLPYLPDVARLELMRTEAYHAADAPSVPPGALGQADPSRLILHLAPSVRAFASRHPALSLWRMNQPGAAKTRLPKGPEYALIARDPGFAVVMEPLDAASHAMLTALLNGRALTEAATTDPTPLLALLIRHQLIASLGETP